MSQRHAPQHEQWEPCNDPDLCWCGKGERFRQAQSDIMPMHFCAIGSTAVRCGMPKPDWTDSWSGTKRVSHLWEQVTCVPCLRFQVAEDVRRKNDEQKMLERLGYATRFDFPNGKSIRYERENKIEAFWYLFDEHSFFAVDRFVTVDEAFEAMEMQDAYWETLADASKDGVSSEGLRLVGKKEEP